MNTVSHVLPTSTKEAAQLISKASFKDFDQADWDAFGGCETKTPRIAHLENNTGEEEDLGTGLVIVQDGKTFYFELVDRDGEVTFTEFILEGRS
jgi:hypothetical protein